MKNRRKRVIAKAEYGINGGGHRVQQIVNWLELSRYPIWWAGVHVPGHWKRY